MQEHLTHHGVTLAGVGSAMFAFLLPETIGRPPWVLSPWCKHNHERLRLSDTWIGGNPPALNIPNRVGRQD